MKLKLDKPTRMWAFVRGNAIESPYMDLRFERPDPDAPMWAGETIERVLVTVTRVPKKGRRK